MKKTTLIILILFGFNFLIQAQSLVRGKIYDHENHESLAGVTIQNLDSQDASISNSKGEFEIKAQINDKLKFSFIGKESLIYEIHDMEILELFLTNSNIAIDEVVVIGYGKTKKSQFTGSSIKLEKERFENSNFSSLDKMLQAEATGLSAIHQSGDPTEQATVFIRGFGSISADISPLYILDGLPISADQVASLNPYDVENVSVLKDASAISIYGSRGANGVIIFTSKKSRSQKFQMRFSAQYNFSDVVEDKLNMMNAEEKLKYEKVLGLNNLSDEAILQKAKSGIDWKEEIFRRGITKSTSIEFGQNLGNTNYMTSFSFHDQKGIVLNSHLKKYTGRLGLNHKINERIKFSLNTNIAHRNSGHADGITSKKILTNSPIVQAYLNNPYDKVRNDDGSFAQTTLGPNAIEDLSVSDNINKQNNLNLQLGMEIKILENLKWNSKLGLEYRQNILDKYNDPSSSLYKSKSDKDLKGALSRGYNEQYNLTQSQTLNSRVLDFKENYLGVILGFESSKYASDDFFVVGNGFGNGSLRTLKAASKANSANGDKTEITNLSYFTRLNYKYKTQLFLDFTLRRDGSSVFGKDKQYGNFYSVGAAYNFKHLIPTNQISYLKLRSSVGTSGNSAIPAYSSLPIFTYAESYNDIPAASQSQLGNEELTWEKSLSYNLGIDLSVFESQFTFTLDIYKRITTDLLINYPLSRTNGFSSIYRNAGEMSNKGVEFSIAYKTKPESMIQWSSKFNFSYNINKIEKLPRGKDIVQTFSIFREGEALGSLYAVEYAGVNPANGNPMWYNNEGVPTEQFNIAYAKVQKPGIPPATGGFFNTISYKGVALTMDWTFAYGNEIFNNAKYFTNSDGEFSSYNQNRDLLYDRWQKPGDITAVPKQIKGGINNQYSTKYIEDGSYLKFKTLELAYTLPTNWVSKINCSKLKFFVKGTNLLTITEYTGFDPELATTIDAFRYPTTKTYSIGVNINL